MALPVERKAIDALRQGEVSLETLYRSIGGGLELAHLRSGRDEELDSSRTTTDPPWDGHPRA